MTSGTTPISTTGATPVTLLSAAPGYSLRVTIINEGAVPGFVSLDGGTTWRRMPATASGASRSFAWNGKAAVMAKVLSGSEMTGLYADAG